MKFITLLIAAAATAVVPTSTPQVVSVRDVDTSRPCPAVELIRIDAYGRAERVVHPNCKK